MQIRSESRLLMIVSIAIAVLPVWRSPMISSRWPRPTGIIESIAFRPACTPSLTGWRPSAPRAPPPRAAADREHRVDRLQARLHRLLDRLALDDARSLELGRAHLGGLDVALAVERAAERVDDAAEERLADRDLEQLIGALDRVALDDLLPVAEEHGADVV